MKEWKDNNRILIVAAHPDDEVLGCGGTIARMTEEGYEAYTLILGEGKTARDVKRDTSSKKGEIAKLQKEINEANKILGVRKTFVYNFPDNRFDSVDLLDIVKVIENIKNQVKPYIIFTHFHNDLNIDHKITNQAVITATRPMQDEVVKEIYAFEVLSSTEWSYPLTFAPDVFININDYIDKKISAMKEYNSELREYPHPRSLKVINNSAHLWGIKVGCKCAEAFKTIRVIK